MFRFDPVIHSVSCEEMAIVGHLNNKFAISVDSEIDNLSNPYFRVYSRSRRSNSIPSACVSFLIPSYISNPFINDSFRLSNSLKRDLMGYLVSPCDLYPDFTIWQYLITVYNREQNLICYPFDWFTYSTGIEHALSIITPIPNYLKLK